MKKHIQYIIKGSGKDHTLPFNVFYVMQSKENPHRFTKLGWTNNIERRRAELSTQYQLEMAVVYDGTPTNGNAPKTAAIDIERMGKNFLTRHGLNGYFTDRYGKNGYEWYESVPNETLATLIINAEVATWKEVEFHEFANYAPRKTTIEVTIASIELVQKTAAGTSRLYYGVAQHGIWLKGRVNKKYGGQPKDWNGDLGRRVVVRPTQRISIQFEAQHPRLCKTKKASVQTALCNLN